ncbi:MAG: amidohydrolase, partial [Lysobacteraceae bacterium]
MSCLPLLPATAEVRVLLASAIHTGDTASPQAQALAWDSDTGRIVAVGGRDTVLGAYPHASRTEAADAVVVPGLIDAHAHLLYLGSTLLQADLGGARSKQEVVARLREFSKELPADAWLRGSGWDQNQWPDRQFPTVADLDAAFPDRPVWLDRIDGHAGWANSAALRQVAQRPGHRDLAGDWQPPGGRIVRDADGQATGVFVDAAMALVTAGIPADTDPQRERMLELALQRAVA